MADTKKSKKERTVCTYWKQCDLRRQITEYFGSENARGHCRVYGTKRDKKSHATKCYNIRVAKAINEGRGLV